MRSGNKINFERLTEQEYLLECLEYRPNAHVIFPYIKNHVDRFIGCFDIFEQGKLERQFPNFKECLPVHQEVENQESCCALIPTVSAFSALASHFPNLLGLVIHHLNLMDIDVLMEFVDDLNRLMLLQRLSPCNIEGSNIDLGLKVLIQDLSQTDVSERLIKTDADFKKLFLFAGSSPAFSGVRGLEDAMEMVKSEKSFASIRKVARLLGQSQRQDSASTGPYSMFSRIPYDKQLMIAAAARNPEVHSFSQAETIAANHFLKHF